MRHTLVTSFASSLDNPSFGHDDRDRHVVRRARCLRDELEIKCDRNGAGMCHALQHMVIDA